MTELKPADGFGAIIRLTIHTYTMEPSTVIIISIAAVVLIVTGFSIYTAFGPPSAQLSDPFEDHED